jgi:hypothetical protein
VRAIYKLFLKISKNSFFTLSSGRTKESVPASPEEKQDRRAPMAAKILDVDIQKGEIRRIYLEKGESSLASAKKAIQGFHRFKHSTGPPLGTSINTCF